MGLEFPDYEVPEEGLYIWKWFWEELKDSMDTPMGITPLSYTEIEKWASLRESMPNSNEIRALREMSKSYLYAVRKRTE